MRPVPGTSQPGQLPDPKNGGTLLRHGMDLPMGLTGRDGKRAPVCGGRCDANPHHPPHMQAGFCRKQRGSVAAWPSILTQDGTLLQRYCAARRAIDERYSQPPTSFAVPVFPRRNRAIQHGIASSRGELALSASLLMRKGTWDQGPGWPSQHPSAERQTGIDVIAVPSPRNLATQNGSY